MSFREAEHIAFDVDDAREFHVKAFSSVYVNHDLNIERVCKSALDFAERESYRYIHFFSGNDVFIDVCQSGLDPSMEVVVSHSDGKLSLFWDHPYFAHASFPSDVFTCLVWDSSNLVSGKAWSTSEGRFGNESSEELRNFIDGIG